MRIRMPATSATTGPAARFTVIVTSVVGCTASNESL
jgi:hypothetical protein